MIRNLFALNMKSMFSDVLRIKPGVKKPSIGKTLFVAVIAVLIAVSFFSMFFVWFAAMLEPFYLAGISFMYFSMFAVTAFALCVISTIFTASAVVFGARDNELLLSMPIKPSAILSSRLLVLLATEYVMALIVALAAFVPWALAGLVTATGLLFFLSGVILLPPMALSVALLLAWVLSLISSRLRYKNIITLVISIAFLIGYLYVNANLQSYLGELVAKGAELAEALRKSLPPFYAFGVSVASGDALNGLVFAAWAILPFTCASALLAVNYRQILAANKGSLRVAYHEKQVKPRSVLSALTAKEMAKYWSKPAVIMNSSFGSIFMFILPIALLEGDGIYSLLKPVVQMANTSIIPIFVVILAFLGSVNGLSASLISLEGKNLWIVKSVPVPAQTILHAKLLAHLLTSAAPCLLASVFIGFILAKNPADWLLVLLVPQTIISFFAAIGLALNLQFPKFDWTNEIYVVKQGVSAMISQLGGMALLTGLGLLYILVLKAIVSVTLYLWLCGAAFALAAFCAYIWLMKAGVKKFMSCGG
jgi:ABC-2 type transport system permease protein